MPASRLTISPSRPALPATTNDPALIAHLLASIGARYEHWDLPDLPRDPNTLLPAALAHPATASRLHALQQTYPTADAVALRPDHPQRAALRQKFILEHRHSEDEVRLFTHGSGTFSLHVDGVVYALHATAGDLVSVPAGMAHWFDAGESPDFAAIRLFKDPEGWVAHYTGGKGGSLG